MSTNLIASLDKSGWDDDLVIRTRELPELRRNQVMVAVEAAGVCHRDLIDRSGRFPWMKSPVVPGHEAVGRVKAVGPEPGPWQIGDRVGTMHRDWCGACEHCARGEHSLCPRATWVYGLMVDGSYARYLVAQPRSLFAIPAEMPRELAAILHCTFGTAYRGLWRHGRLSEGQRALITGANGGVGSAAIQIARRLGAEVYAVVRDSRHAERLEELGATKVIVDPGQSFHKQLGRWRADVALDCVGEPTFNATLRSLRMGGHAIVVGNVTATRASLNLGYIVVNGIRLTGSSGATAKDMQEVVEHYLEEPFTAPIDKTLPLSDADHAQRLVRAGGLEGRIVLIPPGEED